jgi:hypothetical protein
VRDLGDVVLAEDPSGNGMLLRAAYSGSPSGR